MSSPTAPAASIPSWDFVSLPDRLDGDQPDAADASSSICPAATPSDAFRALKPYAEGFADRTPQTPVSPRSAHPEGSSVKPSAKRKASELASSPDESDSSSSSSSSAPVTSPSKKTHVQSKEDPSSPAEFSISSVSLRESNAINRLSNTIELVLTLSSTDPMWEKAMEEAFEGIQDPDQRVQEKAWELWGAIFGKKQGYDTAKEKAAEWLISKDAALEHLGRSLVQVLLSDSSKRGYLVLIQLPHNVPVVLATASCLALSEEEQDQNDGMTLFYTLREQGHVDAVRDAVTELVEEELDFPIRHRLNFLLAQIAISAQVAKK